MGTEHELQESSNRVLIRKCHPTDKGYLRNLCSDTAYFGNSCKAFFPDEQFLADLIMAYYIDHEPEHTWVAQYQNEVVGYLCAGIDEAKYNRIVTFKIIPKALLQALKRKNIWDRRTGRLLKYNAQSFLKGEAALKKISHEEFPAHIHMNIKRGLRGKGIGSHLVEAMLAELKDKTKGIRFRALRQEPNFLFFEKYGFKLLDCRRVKTWERWLGKTPLYFMEYGINFNGS